MQMIDGKIAGVTISNFAASDPNRNPMDNLQVRGVASLEAGNAPLVVIDGMPGAICVIFQIRISNPLPF